MNGEERALSGYFVAPDAFGDLWLWRERGNYPVPVIGQHAFRDDPAAWDLLVAAAAAAPVEHDFGLRGVPGSRDLVVTCSCGWESRPVHLSNTELTRNEHRAEVAAR